MMPLYIIVVLCFVFRAALYDGLSTPIFLEYKSIAQFAWHVMISVSDIFNITYK